MPSGWAWSTSSPNKKKPMNTSPKNTKKITPRWILLSVLSLILFFGLTFVVNGLVTTWCLSPLPGKALNDCNAVSDPQFTQDGQATPEGTPEINIADLPTQAPSAPQVELPPAWDGASRVSVLILGLDYDDDMAERQGPSRTDTMILLTIDPQSRTAGMLSIPRDLWVNIPGFGYGRINTAYYNGDAYKVPGGGPALAMKTVEQVIGVPVQYYAQVKFSAFVNLVDAIGKIEVFVDKKIFIDPRGPGNDEIMLSYGPHILGGVEALAYARQRYTDGGDVDRALRQQKVIMAIREKVLDPANLPYLLANAPDIYALLQQGMNTNLTFDDVMKLGMLAKDIPVENIKRGVIDYSMVTQNTVTVNGQSQQIFKPMPDKIRVLRDEIFTSAGAISPLAQGADALDLARQEGATIAVYNGTYTQGLAVRTSEFLKSQGLNVTIADSATTFPAATLVIDHRGRPYALKYFRELFKLNGAIQVQSEYQPDAPADIEIILGPDWAASNPMP